MDLFVREYGPVGAPAIVFIHGGKMSGWSWEPVVERMQRYHCLVPDLPQYGKSFQHGPFEMSRSADAVAELIRSRAARGRAHVVGFSLGAQVGVQLLATEPKLVDRAVLCGTVINTTRCVRLTQLVLGTISRTTIYRWVIRRYRKARHVPIAAAKVDEYREDLRLIKDAQFASIVVASSGFTVPESLDKSDSPTLFLTGAKEARLVRRWAAALAQKMPNGVDRIALGMRHDWPLRYPDLFSRIVENWLNGDALPSGIALPESGCR
ncbi:alpha/beta hydrolase [Mycobacterium cookii]|uniref:Alpha/beta hydrolase n=1 Tax=Mycobacterium cookii TaxID=1775 RepID=A0A7I7KYC5_9MYCO|nr:alpha/beta hydrolase [Mycobacterium cookii]MCV7331659.1 alpha/beta hydrolase [Mycobacterium cookii]BBX46953.1 alpha/beta hydrolase [Mycobacterium cookii]